MCSVLAFCSSTTRRPPQSPLFPYTTLFRSVRVLERASVELSCPDFGMRLAAAQGGVRDRKSTRLNSSHVKISYAVFCLKKKTSTDFCLNTLIGLGTRSGSVRPFLQSLVTIA